MELGTRLLNGEAAAAGVLSPGALQGVPELEHELVQTRGSLEGRPAGLHGRKLQRRADQDSSKTAVKRRVFREQPAPVLSRGDEIPEPNRRITAPIGQAEVVEPLERFPDRVIALVRMT